MAITTNINAEKIQGNLNIASVSANTISATTYNGYTPLPTQAAISSGVTLSFNTDTVYGTLLTPETSSAITANVTGALLGVTDIIIVMQGIVG